MIAVGASSTLPDDAFKVKPLTVFALTVTAQVADLLFDVFAVIVALPADFAVTVPLDTVATKVDELVHVKAEFLLTVKVYVLLSDVLPFALTVIVAVPAAFAVTVTVVTLPLIDVDTVATEVLLDVTVTDTLPASEGVTVAVKVFVTVP